MLTWASRATSWMVGLAISAPPGPAEPGGAKPGRPGHPRHVDAAGQLLLARRGRHRDRVAHRGGPVLAVFQRVRQAADQGVARADRADHGDQRCRAEHRLDRVAERGPVAARAHDSPPRPPGDQAAGGVSRAALEVGAVRLDPFHGRAVQQRFGLGQVGADHIRVSGQDTGQRLAGRVHDGAQPGPLPDGHDLRVGVRRRSRRQAARADQALVAGGLPLDLGQQLPPLPCLPCRAGLVEHGDPARAFEQDGRRPGSARDRDAGQFGLLGRGQLGELIRASGREEGDDDGPVAEGAADPRHVDALATERGHRHPSPVHAARDQDTDRDGPVSGNVGINDQHADQHERRLAATAGPGC